MKTAVKGLSLALLFILVGHVLILFVDHDLYVHQKKYFQEVSQMKFHFLKKERIELQDKQEKSLNEYRWVNKRTGYVQIPIDRAFDYYLRDYVRE